MNRWQRIAAQVALVSVGCLGAQARPLVAIGQPPALSLVTPVAIDLGLQPPSEPQKALRDGGRVNWEPAYIMQSMVYLLRLTGDEHWAQLLVDWSDSMLADRDAPDPKDGKPFAWLDRAENLTEPYVWAGYTGHMFAPMMEFSRYVMEHPALQTKVYEDKSYRDHALGYMGEFERALDVHLGELTDGGGHAYFSFVNHVPVANKRINGSPLPANMNATLFTAMLHLAKAERESGSAKRAAQLSGYVTRFVAYLNDVVFERSSCGGKTCVQWQYAPYIGRREDVGHANVVVKFLNDAFVDGYPVKKADLIGIANTLEQLIGDNGEFSANLLDGTQVGTGRVAIFYHILLTRYAPALRAKLQPIMEAHNTFAYVGPWEWSLHK